MGSREDDEYWNERYEHLKECDECGEVMEHDLWNKCDDCYNDEEED